MNALVNKGATLGRVSGFRRLQMSHCTNLLPLHVISPLCIMAKLPGAA